MCVIVNRVYILEVYIHHYYHGVIFIWKKLKDKSQNDQNRSSEGKSNRIYEIYINKAIPHGRHIYTKAYDIEKAKMCVYPQSDHVLPHWKCVMRCCSKCSGINLTGQETYDQYSDTSPSIRFHGYHIIVCCKEQERIPLNDREKSEV